MIENHTCELKNLLCEVDALINNEKVIRNIVAWKLSYYPTSDNMSLTNTAWLSFKCLLDWILSPEQLVAFKIRLLAAFYSVP